MTVKAPHGSVPQAPISGVHESDTTITTHQVDVTPVDDIPDDGTIVAGALQKRKYNPTLTAEELGLSKQDWTNRQRMAYIALFAMIILNFALFFVADVSRVDKLGNALSWFDLACAGIVGAFTAMKAFGDSWKGRS